MKTVARLGRRRNLVGWSGGCKQPNYAGGAVRFDEDRLGFAGVKDHDASHRCANALRDGQYFGIVERMTKTDAVTALAALAQDSRLAIFRLLVQNVPAGLTVGLIADQLELPAPTLSFHLKALTHAGLVNTIQEGRFVRCHAAMDRIDALVGFLTDHCCAGHPEICKPPR